MSKLVLDAQPRDVAAKKARHLRNEGLIPAIAYGPGKTPVSLVVEEKALESALRHGGSSQLIEVNVSDGSKHNVLVREVQREPIYHRAVHVDMYLVRMDQKQQVSVPLVTVGKPTSLVTGIMVLQTHEMIEIEALPADIPAAVEVDITNLSDEHPITTRDLPQLSGISYLSDPDEILITMVASQGGAEDGAPAADAVGAAEPEVVKKGKTDEDEA
ncbi:MAG: 50S ribosomal protein L25 [Caldilineaceae bacterium]